MARAFVILLISYSKCKSLNFISSPVQVYGLKKNL